MTHTYAWILLSWGGWCHLTQQSSCVSLVVMILVLCNSPRWGCYTNRMMSAPRFPQGKPLNFLPAINRGHFYWVISAGFGLMEPRSGVDRRTEAQTATWGHVIPQREGAQQLLVNLWGSALFSVLCFHEILSLVCFLPGCIWVAFCALFLKCFVQALLMSFFY